MNENRSHPDTKATKKKTALFTVLILITIACVIAVHVLYTNLWSPAARAEREYKESTERLGKAAQNFGNRIASSIEDIKNSESAYEAYPDATPHSAVDTLTRKDIIERVIRDRIDIVYPSVNVEHILILESFDAEKTENYYANIFLEWSGSGTGDVAKANLQTHNEELVETIAQRFADVQEIEIFWIVPHLNDAKASCIYVRDGNTMHEYYTKWDDSFN